MNKTERSALEILHEEVREIRGDVKKLIEFRGWVLGAACIAGAVGGILIKLV